MGDKYWQYYTNKITDNITKESLKKLDQKNINQDFKLILMFLLLTIFVDIFVLGFVWFAYDGTCGYPGEVPDWSNTHANLSIATWNTKSLSKERFDYFQNLGYDVLVITELWRSGHKYVENDVSFTHSESQLNKDTAEHIFPDDPTSGVGILLSARSKSKYMRHGSPCDRITWVRLKGPVTNIFAISVYIPHRAHVKPCQNDTITTLITLLKTVSKNDCIVLLDDFNDQLPSSVPGYTGTWTHGEKSVNTKSILDVMWMFNLYDVNTCFQPKHKGTTETYTFWVEGTFTSKTDNYVGKALITMYNRAKVEGTVESVELHRGRKRWTLNFDDDFKTKCYEKKLHKLIKPDLRKYKQLDYIMVSHRFGNSHQSVMGAINAPQSLGSPRGPCLSWLHMEMESSWN